MASITSANAILTLVIPGLYTAPQRIQGFSTDDAFDTEAAETKQVMLGIDGTLSAGLVPATTVMTIHLQADSKSVIIFTTWDATEQQIGDALPAEGLVSLPSRSAQYVLTNGFLRNVKRMPDAKRVLQPMTFTIEWEKIIMSPFA